MLPDQHLFLSCVANVARPVSVFILCTNRHGPDNIGYTRYNQTRSWQHWVHKIKTDTGLATLATQDKNRYWPGNIGYSPVSVFILCTQCCQASICFYLVYPILAGQCLFLSCVLNVARPVSVFPENIGYTR
jgi:hypothetical protein